MVFSETIKRNIHILFATINPKFQEINPIKQKKNFFNPNLC